MATYDLEEQEQLAEIKVWWKQYGNLVGGLLTASGATSIYFSWRESERNLIALQAEKAQAAAARIEQYILDIEHQLGWTALPVLDTAADPFEPRRTQYQKLFRLVPAITEVA